MRKFFKSTGFMAILSLFVGGAVGARAKSAPVVTRVKLVQGRDGETARIYGDHFGASPVSLPCRKCLINEMQVLYFVGDDEPLESVTIKAWTNTYIELADIAATAGTTVLFAVKNDASGKTVAATANVPGGPVAPMIKRLVFFRDHRR